MIYINKKKWSTFSDEEMAEYQQQVFDHFTAAGFPYYPTDTDWRYNEMRKLRAYDVSGLIQGSNIKQTMHGLALAWSYMPHSFDVQCGGMATPVQTFNNNLKAVIAKRIKHGDNMSEAGLRKMLRMYSGTQGVSNFRPTVAAALYNRFAPGGSVWDMSCGFGGRLLGFEISDAAIYYGTDPCVETNKALHHIRRDHVSKPTYIMCQGSEDTKFSENELDFAFTSPPYFDWEKYSDEDSQSYKKYPTLEMWIDRFLFPTMFNAYRGLKSGSHCCINIANTKRAPILEEECVKIAKHLGFKHVDTLNLQLSAMRAGFKTEPIFVFKK